MEAEGVVEQTALVVAVALRVLQRYEVEWPSRARVVARVAVLGEPAVTVAACEGVSGATVGRWARQFRDLVEATI